MAAPLDHFLRTGQLGPLVLGMSPDEVQSFLGPPTARSRRLNPLLYKYGPLELAFIAPRPTELRLAQMTLSFQPQMTGLPEAVSVREWSLNAETTISDFNHLLHRWAIDQILTLPPHQMILPSGVRAVFEANRLKQIGISRRDADDNRAPVLTETRVAPVQEIQAQLAEARRAMEAGFASAALMLTWAALEAAMRSHARRAGVNARIGVQPSVLIRELFTLGRLTSDEVTILEQARQLRTSVAHGLPVSKLEPPLIRAVDAIAQRLLNIFE